MSAADTGDVDLCRRLLEERGRLTAELAVARKGADATAVHAVSGILDQVREMDAELASRWNGERDRLGREMVRIRQSHTKHTTPKCRAS